MKSSNMKKVTASIVMLCMLFVQTGLSIENAHAHSYAKTEESFVLHNNIEIRPFSFYMRSASTNIFLESNKVSISVKTYAFERVSSIYHDVTIYKNGKLYSSKRYSDKNKLYLLTTIDVPAKTGDLFEVETTHYTKEGSIVESMTTSNNMVY